MYQALLEVSMNKIALLINVCADDWTAEKAIIASNEHLLTWDQLTEPHLIHYSPILQQSLRQWRSFANDNEANA